jgi:hypothetical protein
MKPTFILSVFSFSAFSFLLSALSFFSVAQTTDFSGSLYVSPNWSHTKTSGVSTVTEKFSRILDQPHTYGTNASQMTAVVMISGTLTNSQAAVVPLATGVADAFGDTIVFSRISVLAVKASADNLGPITLGTSTTNWLSATNATAIIRPGGLILLTAPDAAGYSAGSLTISNASTNTVSYSITVGGS